MNEKSKKIRLYYSVAFSALTVLVGIFFIFGAFRIFAAGGYAQGAYSRVVVGKTLLILAFPFTVWVAGIVAAYVLQLKYPLAPKKFATDRNVSLLKRLLPRVPATANKDDVNKLLREERLRFIAGAVSAVVYLVCIIGAAIYVFDKKNFPADNLNGEMLEMFLHVLPWLALAAVCSVALIILRNYSVKRELTQVKTLVASNKDKSATANPLDSDKLFGVIGNIKGFWAKFRHAMTTDIAKWVVRGCVVVLAGTFIVLGIFNDGMRDVLIKAVNICTECIGLG